MRFKVKIDQLPEEEIAAANAREAALLVREILSTRDALQGLHADEPVQLKNPDGRPWGRNLTIADYKSDLIETDAPDGPVVPPHLD